MQLALIKEKSLNLQKTKEQNIDYDSLIFDLRNELEIANKELEIFRIKNNQKESLDNKIILKFEDEKAKLHEKIELYEKEIENLNALLNSNESSEILKEKLIYWEQRSKSESEKLELLEKSIVANVDSATIEKIFN